MILPEGWRCIQQNSFKNLIFCTFLSLGSRESIGVVKSFGWGHHVWNSIQICAYPVCTLGIMWTLLVVFTFILPKCLCRKSRQCYHLIRNIQAAIMVKCFQRVYLGWGRGYRVYWEILKYVSTELPALTCRHGQLSFKHQCLKLGIHFLFLHCYHDPEKNTPVVEKFPPVPGGSRIQPPSVFKVF